MRDERKISLGYIDDFAGGRNILPKGNNNKQVMVVRRSVNHGSGRKGHNLNQTIGGAVGGGGGGGGGVGLLPKFRGGTAFERALF